MTYKLLKNYFPDGSINPESVAVMLDGYITIPFDPANQDFVQYKQWLDEGNTPLPADE
jgi:hypothetical protein